MDNVYFEELETVESMADAADLGAVFGAGFLLGIVIYVGIAT